MTACTDCPDLMLSELPPGTKQRATCCRDDHIARRLEGDYTPWLGTEIARKISDDPAKVGDAPMSRQQRRWQERKGAR